MTRKNLFAVSLLALAGTVSGAIADPPKDPEYKNEALFPLPPGWTATDMQAVIDAGAPGKMHEHLGKDVGVWHGKNTMWMAPGAEPVKSESTSTIKPLMGGRFTQVEVKGEMQGMGPFNAVGTYGFDNVAQKFVSTWIDNHGTGMMNGTGELSRDGKTLTWKFSYNCPVTKKPAVMRQVETTTGPKTKTLEMFAAEPKSGKVYKMMSIELSKK